MESRDLDPRVMEQLMYDASYRHPSLEARETQADLDRFQRIMDDPNG